MERYMRTWCDIDLDAIRDNLLAARERAGGAMVMAVIKADGYGHGAKEIARYVEEVVDYFAVATIEEGIELREDGIKKPIMILGYHSPSAYDLNLKYDIEQTIYSIEAAEAMSAEAVKAGKTARIHLALDTGMTRIGLSPDEKGLAQAEKINRLPGIEIHGLFTHFSCADMEDKTYTWDQIHRFEHFCSLLEAADIHVPVRHVCNSAAIMEFSHHRYEMVRSGITTYGLYPSDEVVFENMQIRPALTWKAHVVNIMEPEQGRGVSYGATYIVDRPCRLATISIGYADGYSRHLSNKGAVLIRGKRAPIVGRVCMDQMMVDVTDIPDVEMEDQAVLIGTDGSESITADDIAAWTGTINYEVVCAVSQRVPRIYHGKRL